MNLSDDQKEYKTFFYDSCVNENQGHNLKGLSKQINVFLNENSQNMPNDSPTNYSNLDNEKANDLFFLFG